MEAWESMHWVFQLKSIYLNKKHFSYLFFSKALHRRVKSSSSFNTSEQMKVKGRFNCICTSNTYALTKAINLFWSEGVRWKFESLNIKNSVKKTIQQMLLIVKKQKKTAKKSADARHQSNHFSVKCLTGRYILIIAELGLLMELSPKIAMQFGRVVL